MATVLVVDDEPAILEVVAEFARMLGHDVLTAIDGEDALVLLRDRRPDVIVSDVMMPRLSGPALRIALLAAPRLAAVPVVFMTAVHLPPLDDGTPYIKKPFDLEELERALGDALAGSLPDHAERPRTVEELARELDDGLGRARGLVTRMRDDGARADTLDELERLLTDLSARVSATRHR